MLGPGHNEAPSPSENEEAGVSPQKTKRKVKKEEHERILSGKEMASVKYFHDLETHVFRTEVSVELFPRNPTTSC